MVDTVQPSETEGKSPDLSQRESAAGLIDAKHDGHRRWTLIGKNASEFTRTAEELVEAAQVLSNQRLFTANLTGVFKKIIGWCDQNEQLLKSGFMTVRPGKISLLFVSATERYDLTLDDAMTNLEVSLGGSGIGYVESFQIPERSAGHFPGPDAVEVWRRTKL
jgi:hypothetical protein